MITNEERREVAARLLEHARTARWVSQACVLNYCIGEECVNFGIEGKFGIEGCEGCFNKSLTRLADLIEPEAERTCRNEAAPSWHVFECSECGCVVCGGDERGHDSSKGAFNYCPNCGAKVVE
jgi:hypothetical protein